MAGKKYPLDSLVGVRKRRQDAATRDVGVAIREREAAERQRCAAEEERARHVSEARAVQTEEARALARGERSVLDLQRQGAWQARVDLEADERAHKVARARQREEASVTAEAGAKVVAATAEAETKVVTRHREAWSLAEERAREAAAEEAATEAWRPKR
jgi:hypothetical protein